MKAPHGFYLRLGVTAACYAVLLWQADLGLLAHALVRIDWKPSGDFLGWNPHIWYATAAAR